MYRFSILQIVSCSGYSTILHHIRVYLRDKSGVNVSKDGGIGGRGGEVPSQDHARRHGGPRVDHPLVPVATATRKLSKVIWVQQLQRTRA
ncbi:hypothetical protein PM082_020700 [Marasmius tenuissimus]|nr:hypothetical protein PM082_020700 [Marasmius tenuissimus]